MKVIVLQKFRDKNNFSKVYEEDEILEFDKHRTEELIQRGLVEIVDENFFGGDELFAGEVKPSIEELKLMAKEMGYTLEQVKPVDEPKSEIKSQEGEADQVTADLKGLCENSASPLEEAEVGVKAIIQEETKKEKKSSK